MYNYICVYIYIYIYTYIYIYIFVYIEDKQRIIIVIRSGRIPEHGEGGLGTGQTSSPSCMGVHRGSIRVPMGGRTGAQRRGHSRVYIRPISLIR